MVQGCEATCADGMTVQTIVVVCRWNDVCKPQCLRFGSPHTSVSAAAASRNRKTGSFGDVDVKTCEAALQSSEPRSDSHRSVVVAIRGGLVRCVGLARSRTRISPSGLPNTLLRAAVLAVPPAAELRLRVHE